MANTYTPESLGIKPPPTGFQEGGWYAGRQYWGGKLSDPGVINPLSNQQGAGELVSPEVNAQSATAQGKSPAQLEAFLQQQRNIQSKNNVNPTQVVNPNPNAGMPTDVTMAGVSTGAGTGVGITPAPVLNLPDLYKSLYEKEGISAIEEGLNTKAKAFADAQLKINDNPFLAEATRVGRADKLEKDYNNRIKNDQDLLVMKKQDIATQLDLATKQFDINSQSAKMALDQFNTLLSSGALAGASGNDIASITRATGISSTMIQSAINAQKQKDVQTSVSTVDDGKNIYSVVINSKTGEVISKQVISASKPSAPKEVTESQKKETYQSALRTDARNGVPLEDIFKIYTGYLDPNEILNLYNTNSTWGPAKQSPAELTKYGVKDTTKAPTLAEQIVALQTQ